MIDILIIEDEPVVAKRLVQLLETIPFNINILDILDSVEESIQWLGNHPDPDIIFADIELSDGRSFDIFKRSNIDSSIIFTTSFDQYAIEAFKHNSIDYLLKPIREVELIQSLEKYNRLSLSSSNDFQRVVRSIKGEKRDFRRRFLVKSGETMRSIKTDEIAYFYLENRNLFIKLFSGGVELIDHTIDSLVIELDPEIFFKISRQIIVHIDSIKSIKPYFSNRLILELEPESHEEVVVTKSNVKGFRLWLGG
jgi:DNA-binding LytR/AlgR family response regulator